MSSFRVGDRIGWIGKWVVLWFVGELAASRGTTSVSSHSDPISVQKHAELRHHTWLHVSISMSSHCLWLCKTKQVSTRRKDALIVANQMSPQPVLVNWWNPELAPHARCLKVIRHVRAQTISNMFDKHFDQTFTSSSFFIVTLDYCKRLGGCRTLHFHTLFL